MIMITGPIFNLITPVVAPISLPSLIADNISEEIRRKKGLPPKSKKEKAAEIIFHSVASIKTY